MPGLRTHLLTAVGNLLGTVLPEKAVRALSSRVMQRNPMWLYETIGPLLNRNRTLENMPFDLDCQSPATFEKLAGLFASTSFDHAVISMPIRQAAYLYGTVQRLPGRKIVEIGRYKGGSTLVIAAAMNGQGEFWSIDIGEKVNRLSSESAQNVHDAKLQQILTTLGLRANLIIGDSRTYALETGGELDLVFIDGDHSYEGVKNDFERFGRRVRVGGAVLFDDTFDEELFKTHSDEVGRLVREITATGEFRLVKAVNRLAHIERTA